MNKYGLALMAGVDVPISELQITAHSPTAKEIALIGEDDYFSGLQIICLKKEHFIQDKSIISSLSNFQVFMKVLTQGENRSRVDNCLRLIFPRYRVVMTPNSIIFTLDQETKMIDKDSFDTFQEAMRDVLCIRNLFVGDQIQYNTKSALAKKIEEKIMRGRRRVAEIKSKESQKGGGILVRYLSILSVALQLPLEYCISLNLFQIFDLMDRYDSWYQQEVEMKVRLAGGTIKEPVASWRRDLYAPQK